MGLALFSAPPLLIHGLFFKEKGHLFLPWEFAFEDSARHGRKRRRTFTVLVHFSYDNFPQKALCLRDKTDFSRYHPVLS